MPSWLFLQSCTKMPRCCIECNAWRERVDLPGSARMVLVDNVVPFDPEPQIFEPMLEGWARQQRVGFLKKETIDRRLALVRRASRFSGQYPWQWSAAEIGAFIDDLRSGSRPIKVSTARGHLTNLQLFLGFVTDPRYGWAAACMERFGQAPQQVLCEWNTITHANEYEGAPERRPFTYDEVQALFDAADGLVESIRARRRKGALAAQRDAALLKMFYAFGLRRREAWGLDLADLRRNPKMPALGQAGVLQVRWGGGSRRAAGRRSGEPFCWCRRWIGSFPSWSSGWRKCGRCSRPGLTRRGG